MGRLLLLTLALAACAPSATRVAGEDGHGDLSCATCHRGGQADLGMASVPETTCGESGCHSDPGPRRIETTAFAFEHRDHGGDSTVVDVDCTGCHTHGVEAGPLTAGVDACALCHADALDGDRGRDCRLCHAAPEHIAVTSQWVSLPHDELPWIGQSCVRCHFEVDGIAEDTPADQCSTCHLNPASGTASGTGTDVDGELHPAHQGKACVSCHTSGMHQSTAMSSAVELDCLGCHREPHETVATEGGIATVDCNSCHADSHAEQQRLLLGMEIPAGLEGAPSEKFMDGLSCRSCHVASPRSRQTADLRGSGVGCTGCHRPEYATVLSWWRQGGDQRVALTRRYVSAARSGIGDATASVAEILRESEELLEFVASAGPQHNIPLSHDLLEESLRRSADAYREAGRRPPEIPSLGTRPRMGLCSYCHYRTNDPWTFSTMPEDFHQEVMAPREGPPS